MNGLEMMNEDSVLDEHLNEYHDGDASCAPCHKFKMNVTACHKTALDRMVTEAVSIDMTQQTKTRRVLNR